MKRVILSVALAMISTISFAGVSDRVIEANITKSQESNKEAIFNCIGAGRAAEGLRATWQNQLAMVQRDLPFDYIRFHGLFHDDMGVYINGNYNFQYIDQLYDFLLSIGIKPFVELSFMPEQMASGDKTVFWWKGNVTPPADYDKWEELIRRFTQHVTARYGSEEVRSWYFEVWNEPNHSSFFSSDMAEYFKMYESAAKAVKSVNSEYRVGGPATAGNQWVVPFIEHCKKNNLPLDFISTHNYGVRGALDEFGKKQLRLIDDKDYVWGTFKTMRDKMDKMGHKDLELHYTEWNTSYSPRDLVHDTYLNAAYVLNTLRHTPENIQSLSYWTFTDIFEESGIPTKPFHGGFGLITMSGLKKPSYFAYQYLNQLGMNEAKNSDKNSWVCSDNDGNVQVLAYDLTMPIYDKNDSNNTYFGKVRESKLKNNLKVKLSGLKDGKYNVEIYKTGYRQNDIQTIYYDMGSPVDISPVQHKILEQHSQNSPVSIEFVEVKGGKFTTELPLRENDLYFINMTLAK